MLAFIDFLGRLPTLPPSLSRQPLTFFAPASCSRRIPMICSSVKRLGFMSISQRAMDSTHFWMRFRGSGQSSNTPRARSRNIRPPSACTSAPSRRRGRTNGRRSSRASVNSRDRGPTSCWPSPTAPRRSSRFSPRRLKASGEFGRVHYVVNKRAPPFSSRSSRRRSRRRRIRVKNGHRRWLARPPRRLG